MYGNKVAIGGFDLSGSYYWSSSEKVFNYSWGQRFSDGAQYNRGKGLGLPVRCVRR